jgi:hypothetical protein
MSGQPGDVRCASWARDVGLDPAGTAPPTDVFVVVEHPLPWPSDIGDDPFLAHLGRVAAEAAGPERQVRVQAVVAEAAASDRRVVVFAAGPRPFVGYSRAEAAGPPDALPGLVGSLVGAEPVPVAPGPVTDVLVCTHGSRDACCGSLGTRLHAALAGRLDGVRVWRTSHTGGHRFAPTIITFPDGCYWAHVDADRVDGIVARTLPAAVAASHLRGCAAFSPSVQVADGAAFGEHGWSWLETPRFGEERRSRRVELCFETADGRRGGYDVCLDEHRRMPIPSCPGDPAIAAKFHAELRVSSFVAWS